MGVEKYIMICPKSTQTIVQNLHLEFLLHFWKQQENPVMMLDSTQGVANRKKFNSTLQVATSFQQ
jgi:hypothetical protein